MIDIIIKLTILFAVIQLLIAAVNFFFKFNDAKILSQFNGFVSILIPARNEENNIGKLLIDLSKQTHKNFEILVFNDLSNDRTGEIVSEFAASDPRITLINSEGLPEGWLGKNYGCHRLSQEAKGKFYIFIDADVRLDKELIGKIATKASTENLKLLSIFPKQIMVNLGEWLTVPLMNQILLTILPLISVKFSRYSSLAAANGQFMLFDAALYQKLKPHYRLRHEKVEDIAIARLLKKEGNRIDCLASEPKISCRMYKSAPEAIQGFSKNITHFFGNSTLLAILFWSLTFLGPLITFLQGQILVSVILFILILVTRLLTSVTSHQNLLINLILYLPQQIMLGIIIAVSIFNNYNKTLQWKGRNIS